MKRSKRAKRARSNVNAQLRQWTRGISFTLAMGKSQVATLVALHWWTELAREAPRLSTKERWARGIGTNVDGAPFVAVGIQHRLLSNSVVSGRCLEDRGLMVRDNNANMRQRITEAGEHVVALLKLSGIYDEITTELLRFTKDQDRSHMRLVG